MPNIIDLFKGAVANLVMERPARKRTLAEWAVALAESGKTIEERVGKAKDAIQTQKQLRHITGIERWGQRRLRVFLGEPFVQDEYDTYQPETTLTTDQQLQAFRTTRAETVALARQLANTKLDETPGVRHNSFGEVSAGGWLRYLEMHARLESKKIA